MEYNKIVSVTGLPGLFELVSSKSDGAIVRSLDDKTTRFASSRIHNFSHLETIEVYTVGDNVNLADVFHAMEKSSDSLPDTKDNDAVKKYFKKVYADIDFERVYNSDLKKMIKWFDVLKNNNIEIKLSEPKPEETEKEVMNEEKPEPVKNGKKEPLTTKPETEKKTAKKSAKAASEKEEGKEEKKPAKKAAKKKEK